MIKDLSLNLWLCYKLLSFFKLLNFLPVSEIHKYDCWQQMQIVPEPPWSPGWVQTRETWAVLMKFRLITNNLTDSPGPSDTQLLLNNTLHSLTTYYYTLSINSSFLKYSSFITLLMIGSKTRHFSWCDSILQRSSAMTLSTADLNWAQCCWGADSSSHWFSGWRPQIKRQITVSVNPLHWNLDSPQP